MKIVSQLSNAVLDTTTKSTSVDTSESNFQSTFAASIGSRVVTPEKTVGPGPEKKQGVDAKQSSSSDSKRKSSSSSPADGAITAQVLGDSPQLLSIASPVSVSTVPQIGDSATPVTSTDHVLGQLLPGDVMAGDNSDAAQIAAMRGQSLPVLDTASARNVAANGQGVSDTSDKPIALPMAASEATSMPGAKTSDTAEDKTSGAVGTGAQSKEAASSGTGVNRDASATDASSLSQFSLPFGAPQSIPQPDASATSTMSNTRNFKLSAAKSDAPGPVGGVMGSASGKGKTASTRTYGSTDYKQTATGTDSESMKARIGAAEVISKDVSGGAEELAQETALAQSTHASLLTEPTHSVDAQGAAAQSISNSAGPSAPAQLASAENAQAAHEMSSAQLIQSAHGSEMRLGMQSAEFGNISISTSLNHQALSAQISIDHSALGHALAAHLPAIEEKLGSAYGIQARVELRDTGSRSSFTDSSSQEPKGNRQSQTGNNGGSTAVLRGPIGALTSSTYTSITARSSRLDIRI